MQYSKLFLYLFIAFPLIDGLGQCITKEQSFGNWTSLYEYNYMYC